MLKEKMILLIFIFLVVILVRYIYIQTKFAKENRVNLESNKIKGEIRITQISDFHSNKLRNLDYLLEKIKLFNPNFIILTGDINDYGEIKKFNKAVFLLDKISSLGINTIYITGNHEESGGMTEEFIEEVKKRDIYFLHNSSIVYETSENRIYFYGTGFYDFSYKNFNPIDNGVNIVLCHNSKFVRNKNDGREDFVFSGHTHGGQIRLPVIGALFAPGEGILPKYSKGIYNYNNTVFYIDSGLGNTKFDLRFLDQIQFSNITIKECQ